jgi:C4-dicarboxylate-specific signal transduction histidine kinase
VAHELNNPLNNIGLFVGNTLDMLSMDGDKEAMRRELRSTMQQVRKATEIISHLRTFGRAAHVTREPLSVNDVIFRALSLVQEQFRLRQIRVELELEAGEGAIVVGNGIRLEQAFINLLTNARDAVVDADTKQVRISSTVTEEHVELVFEDSGCGIPAGCEKRIFDPFFTTKPVGSGTGLGLSITYGIITDHGGTIAVASRPGSGARFVVQLPLARTDGPAAGEE